MSVQTPVVLNLFSRASPNALEQLEQLFTEELAN